MGTLDDILAGMDESLFADSDDDYVEVRSDESSMEEHPPVFQEDISNESAKDLLGEDDYDPKCHYQLITTPDATIIAKIDDAVTPEEEAAALEQDPDTSRLHIQEFTLKVNSDEVQTYAEMQQDYVGISTPKQQSSIVRTELLDYKLKRHPNYIKYILVTVLLALFAFGLYQFLQVYQHSV